MEGHIPKANSGAQPVPSAIRDRLRAAVAVSGERNVAQLMQLNRHTLARAIAGLGLRRGTVAQLEKRLPVLESGAVS